MAEKFDPYHQWLGIPPEDQPPHFYRLLSVNAFETDANVISNAADRQMRHVRAFQTGKRGNVAQKLLNEISAAKGCLLNPKKKAKYDERLKTELDPLAENVAGLPQAQALPVASSPQQAVPVVDAAKSKSSNHSSPMVAIIGLGVASVLLIGVVTVAYFAFFAAQGNTSVALEGSQTGDGTEPADASIDANEDDDSQSPADNEPAPADDALEPVTPDTLSTDGVEPPIADSVEPTDGDALPDGGEPAEDDAIELPPADDGEPVDATEPVVSGDPKVDEPASSKRPIPSTSTRDASRKQIMEIFSVADAKTAEEKQLLAANLLKQADDIKVNSSDYFAILNIARELACQSADAEQAFQAIQLLDAEFDINADSVKVAALREAAEASLPLEARTEVIPVGIKFVDELLARHDYIKADSLIGILQGMARKLRDRERLVTLAERRKISTPLAEKQSAYVAATQTLASEPDNSSAHAAVGKYLLIVKRDTSSAMPHLAASDDQVLKPIAELELAAPETAEAQERLASAWWDAAEKAGAESRATYRVRAGQWYQNAASGLTGLLATKVEQRLKELADAGVSLSTTTPINHSSTGDKPRVDQPVPEEIKGTIFMTADNAAHLKINGRTVQNAGSAGNYTNPETIRVGDVITIMVDNKSNKTGVRLAFRSLDEKYGFCTNALGTWKEYHPEDLSADHDFTPSKDDPPAILGLSPISPHVASHGLGAQTIRGTGADTEYLYHIVTEQDLQPLVNFDYPGIKKTTPKVKTTLHFSADGFVSMVVNGIPLLDGTIYATKVERELQVGDVICVRAFDLDGINGFALVAQNENKQTLFHSNRTNWFAYKPKSIEQWWDFDTTARWPNATAAKDRNLRVLRSRELVGGNTASALAIWGYPEEQPNTTVHLFHVVTKEDLTPQ